jgi:hypothetical protein
VIERALADVPQSQRPARLAEVVPRLVRAAFAEQEEPAIARLMNDVEREAPMRPSATAPAGRPAGSPAASMTACARGPTIDSALARGSESTSISIAVVATPRRTTARQRSSVRTGPGEERARRSRPAAPDARQAARLPGGRDPVGDGGLEGVVEEQLAPA